VLTGPRSELGHDGSLGGQGRYWATWDHNQWFAVIVPGMGTAVRDGSMVGPGPSEHPGTCSADLARYRVPVHTQPGNLDRYAALAPAGWGQTNGLPVVGSTGPGWQGQHGSIPGRHADQGHAATCPTRYEARNPRTASRLANSQGAHSCTGSGRVAHAVNTAVLGALSWPWPTIQHKPEL
jgi:hypothetical protein